MVKKEAKVRGAGTSDTELRAMAHRCVDRVLTDVVEMVRRDSAESSQWTDLLDSTDVLAVALGCTLRKELIGEDMAGDLTFFGPGPEDEAGSPDASLQWHSDAGRFPAAVYLCMPRADADGFLDVSFGARDVIVIAEVLRSVGPIVRCGADRLIASVTTERAGKPVTLRWQHRAAWNEMSGRAEVDVDASGLLLDDGDEPGFVALRRLQHFTDAFAAAADLAQTYLARLA